MLQYGYAIPEFFCEKRLSDTVEKLMSAQNSLRVDAVRGSIQTAANLNECKINGFILFIIFTANRIKIFIIFRVSTLSRVSFLLSYMICGSYIVAILSLVLIRETK